VSPFVENKIRKFKKRLMLSWISEKSDLGSSTEAELEVMFMNQFCESIPQIINLTGIGYNPGDTRNLIFYLEKFVNEGKIIHIGGSYSLV